ncbi:DUF5789 family protein [Natronobacterium texcoconense]|uniref:DUF2795 domain-containing protein n=1 Tax=Natronobacterium texcoconense TaxID=1095778 RepID=A0A1H1G7T4_NATTX|nr:hypothetical protein [Natronobacterium texcoconense]SDR09213.1 hypothetical protein SAMN04489842_2302 [Natronobacterium texcoconense]
MTNDNPAENAADDQLGTLDSILETHQYPTTTDDLIAEHGEFEVQSQDGETTLRELLEPIDDETYDSADEVQNRILRLLHR